MAIIRNRRPILRLPLSRGSKAAPAVDDGQSSALHSPAPPIPPASNAENVQSAVPAAPMAEQPKQQLEPDVDFLDLYLEPAVPAVPATEQEAEQESEPEPQQEPEQEQRPKSRLGRPRRGPRREVAVELPKGMTDAILLWACDLKPRTISTSKFNTVYRWRTGQTSMPDVAKAMIAMWEKHGRDEFLRIMSKTRGSEPPTIPDRPPNFGDLLVEILRDNGETMTSHEVEEIVTQVYGVDTNLKRVSAMLYSLMRSGRIETIRQGRINHWKVAEVD